VSAAEIAVVVPTRDRPEMLTRLLDGLRMQRLPSDRFAVIVIDDGSSASSTQHVLAEESERGELALRSVRNETALG
jgi:glycosyltransferase involved in cell wall biosynthesis